MLPTQDKKAILGDNDIRTYWLNHHETIAFSLDYEHGLLEKQIAHLEELGYHKDTKISIITKPIVDKCEGMDDIVVK